MLAHQSALPWDTLPRLFQDAILITRRIGYRYLWIDSLCIVQDSPNDWRQEMTRMGSIYKHCVFIYRLITAPIEASLNGALLEKAGKLSNSNAKAPKES
jgi:hypothetical protein